jgi:hypothetical protein
MEGGCDARRAGTVAPKPFAMIGLQVLAALVLAAAPAGCSQRQVYEAVQQNRQLECQKLPQGQYEQCMERYSEPYESYTRERRELERQDGS